MTLPVWKPRGGFRRKDQEGQPLQLSLFIREQLMNGDAIPHDIYIAYKKKVQEVASPESILVARRRIRRALARSKRSHKGQRVKVFESEIDADLKSYMADHPAKKKRHCCSYNSFMHYIYVLKRLGLVEDTPTEYTAKGKSGSVQTEWHELHPSSLVRAVPGGLNDPGWNNIWLAYGGYKAYGML